MKSLKISLIIPIYNVEKYLRKCLHTAINQTLKEIEIILVNDGSTDGSLSICEEYQKIDNRIKIITQKNGGLSVARNTGIRTANGEFLAFLDSDDYINCEMLESMYNYCVNNGADIGVCNYAWVDEFYNITAQSSNKNSIKTRDEAFGYLLSNRTNNMACNKIYKRKIFTQNNLFYPEGRLHEDAGLTYQLFWHAKAVIFIDKTYYYYLRRDGTISKTISIKHIEDTFLNLDETKNFLVTNQIDFKYENEYLRLFFIFVNSLLLRIADNQSLNLNQFDILNLILNNVFSRMNEIEHKLSKLSKIDYKAYETFSGFLKLYEFLHENNFQKIKDFFFSKEIEIKNIKFELNEIKQSKEYRIGLKLGKYVDRILPPFSKRKKMVKDVYEYLKKKQNQKLPLISIIMPVYNGEKYIRSSIESIINQTYNNYELIIVDNNSTDQTVAIVTETIKHYNNIRLEYCKIKGVSNARNYGIDKAIGEYICFLDADDLYEIDVIEKRTKFILSTHSPVSTCNLLITDQNLRIINRMKARKLDFKDFFDCPVHTNTVMFRADIIRKVKFDSMTENGEDWLAWSRVARMGYKYEPIVNCNTYYIQRESTVRQDYYKHIMGLLSVIDKIYSDDSNFQFSKKKYKNGLKTPEKVQITNQRLRHLFIYGAFNDVLYADIAQKINKEIVNKLRLLDIYEEILLIAKKFFLIEGRNLFELLQNRKDKDYGILQNIYNKDQLEYFYEKILIERKGL